MSNYLHLSGSSGDALVQTSSPAPDAADLNGESQFDLRFEGLVTYGDRLIEDSNGVVYLGTSALGVLNARTYDGTARNFTCDTALPSLGFWQVRAVFDGTSDPMTCTFYYRSPGTDLSTDTGWTQVGSVESIAGSFGGQTVVTTPFNIGARSGSVNELSARRAWLGYGASNTEWIDVDLTSLTTAELEAASFVDGAGIGWEMPTNVWAYVRYKPTIAGKTPELLLEASDGNKGFSPKWADRSGNNHHAQRGSAAGADTNDPLFKRFDGEQYLYLPGSASNYASTPDVNLLDADTAHGIQGSGLWGRVGTWTSLTPTQDSEQSLFGGTSHRFTATADRTGILCETSVGTAGPAIAASTQYAWGVWVFHTSSADIGLRVLGRQYDSGGIASATFVGSTVTVAPNTWTFLEVAGNTADASAAYAGMAIQQVTTGQVDNGSSLWIDQAVIRIGSDGTFVRSLRIVGDLDMEMRMSLPDVTPASNMDILNTGDSGGNNGYRALILTSGNILFRHGTGAANRQVNATAANLGLSADTVHTVQCLYDISAGTYDVLVDGVSVQSGATATGAASPTGQSLLVGAFSASVQNFAGDVYYVIVRDGIGGPIVAEYRASDASEPFATHTGAQDGRTWTHNRSASGLVSTVVDRDMFLLTTDDYFVVPDDAGLDSGADEDITLVLVFRKSLDTAVSRALVHKGILTGNPYYLLRISVTETPDWLARDTTGASDRAATDSGALSDNTLYTMAGRRDGVNGFDVFVDGEIGDTEGATTSGDWSNASDLYIGARLNASVEKFFEGQIVAVALFREALTDNEILAVGNELAGQGGAVNMMLLGVA